MDKETMSYILGQVEEIEKELQVVGVAPNQIHEVIALISRYGDLQEDLREHRTAQFADDADVLLLKLRREEAMTSGGSKVYITCTFLRDFAEHIVGHLVGHESAVIDSTPKHIDGFALGRKGIAIDLVDEIPPMNLRSFAPLSEDEE